jgi:arginyl-tRNA synthetase
MLREKVEQEIIKSLGQIDLETSTVQIGYPEPQFGDYSSNAALTLAKEAKMNPMDLAKKIVENLDQSMFEKVEIAKPGFINFKLKAEQLLNFHHSLLTKPKISPKILVEYFQPNIAKPMHVGLLRTAIIGDAISRMLKFLGYHVESDTHMGDWGTQFGFLLLAYKKYADDAVIAKDPINELNKLYVRINAKAEVDEDIREEAKQEFVKLERGDAENRKIWQKFVDWSLAEFLQVNDLMDIQKFDHHWPESFYEDKMPVVLEKLKVKGLLKESQGAQIVDLAEQGLGVAVVVKSDTGTTYLLRDLATFIYRKEEQGFARQLYVVDNRQSHAFQQLFAILKLMGEIKDGEAEHIDYGFISFKGEALSTRKGNMVLASDVIAQAEEKVSQIIAQKNPELKNKDQVIKAVTKAALKYFDLKHNRHSDIEFNWDDVLDFDGDSGPYLQYAHARLCSILRRAQFPISNFQFSINIPISNTERELLFKLSILPEVVEDAVKDFLPNILANYLYNLATLINKFYHESPVLAEKDEAVKNFRLGLISKAKETLGTGLDLLGIVALEEM